MTNADISKKPNVNNSLALPTYSKSSFFSSVCEALRAIPDTPTTNYSQKSCDYKKGNKIPSSTSTRHSSEDVNPEVTGFDGQTYFDMSQILQHSHGASSSCSDRPIPKNNQQIADRDVLDVLLYRNSTEKGQPYVPNAVNRDVFHPDRLLQIPHNGNSKEQPELLRSQSNIQNRTRGHSHTSREILDVRSETDKIDRVEEMEKRDGSHEKRYRRDRARIRGKRRDKSRSSSEYIGREVHQRGSRNRARKHKRSISTTSDSDDFMFNPANFDNWEEEFNRRIAQMHDNVKMKDYMAMSEGTVRQILSQFVRNGRSSKTTLDDEFVLLYFKTINCEINYTHNWQNCPFCHGPNDLRRPFLIFKYSPMPCKSWYRYANVLSMEYSGRCPHGKLCGESHSRKEYFYHPNCFRTETCSQYHRDGYCKRGVFCAFRH